MMTPPPNLRYSSTLAWAGDMSGRVTLFIAVMITLALTGQQSSAAPPENPWDIPSLRAPPEVFPAPEFPSSDDRIRPLFFAGPLYRGEPTRVFAWIGLPKLAEGARAPGIVLLHGGGGTAFESWVKLWVDRGYAAIAIDHFGTLPHPENAKPRPRNPSGGPPGGGATFAQLGAPLRDQWPYQAATAAILAHSLLLAQPDVDPERTGVTGISWGGYLTCLVAGLDSRLKFAAPVYGCGNYEETIFASELQKLPPEQSALWYAQWDAKNYIPDIRCPVLWVNGTNDKYFWPPAWQRSHQQMPPSLATISLHREMQHGHPPAGDPGEILTFSDSVVRGGGPLPRVLNSKLEARTVIVDFDAAGPPLKAELIYTSDTWSQWSKRQWRSVPAPFSGNRIEVTLPNEARIYYVSLWDVRGFQVSTPYSLDY